MDEPAILPVDPLHDEIPRSFEHVAKQRPHRCVVLHAMSTFIVLAVFLFGHESTSTRFGRRAAR